MSLFVSYAVTFEAEVKELHFQSGCDMYVCIRDIP